MNCMWVFFCFHSQADVMKTLTFGTAIQKILRNIILKARSVKKVIYLWFDTNIWKRTHGVAWYNGGLFTSIYILSVKMCFVTIYQLASRFRKYISNACFPPNYINLMLKHHCMPCEITHWVLVLTSAIYKNSVLESYLWTKSWG